MTEARQFDAARAVKVKSNPGGIPKTEEEEIKAQRIRDLVNPTEIQYRKDELSRQVTDLVRKHKFDDARTLLSSPLSGLVPEVAKPVAEHREKLLHETVNPAQVIVITNETAMAVSEKIQSRDFDDARNLLWSPLVSLVPEVEKPVAEHREKLLHETVNRTQFILITNEMAVAVDGKIKAGDFDGARQVLNDVRPVRVYADVLENSLQTIRTTLIATEVPEADAGKIVVAVQPVLDKLFSDAVLRTTTIQPGETFKPDESAYKAALESFGKELTERKVPDDTAKKILSAIDKIAQTSLHALWVPQETVELTPPNAIGTSKMNEMVAEAKKRLYEESIVPAQIAHRAKELRDGVLPLVEAGKLDEARTFLHAYGVTGFPEIDDPVFAVKLGLLNARVNMAEWDARQESLTKAVYASLATGDLDAASAAIEAVKPVPAYGAPVDEALLAAQNEAEKQGAASAATVVESTKTSLYNTLAPRPDAEREARIMRTYLSTVSGLTPGKVEDEPDWSSVRKSLDDATEWLVRDDVPQETADALMADVLSGFKALAGAGGTTDNGRSSLTTEELNKRIADFKAELSAKVAAGVSAKMSAASLVQESPSLEPEELARRLEMLRKAAAEKVSPEFAETLHRETAAAAKKRIEEVRAAEAKAAAERAKAAAKAAAAEAAAKAEAERLRQLAIEMAERAAATVDFDARINAFVEAVSDRTEPDLNRILGDGARILRLKRAGATISREEATSLLAAAVYMGFDDVMNLANVLGADVNGSAAKDERARPVLLLAMQYGFRGRAAAVLEKANRQVCDASGDGALHYAVRGGNGTALVDLLRAGIDAKKPGAGGATPIVLAADLGYAGFVQALIPFSDLEKPDDEGFTALLRATQNGRLDIVRNLVAAGADLKAKTAAGDGVLELAAKANAPDLLAWLLDEKKIAPGARVVSQLVIAGNVPTLQAMVAHGGRLSDDHLAVAVKLGNFPMVKYLVNCGMDVNAESVKAVSGEAGGKNDGSYYGPDGDTIRAFLHEQGQRP